AGPRLLHGDYHPLNVLTDGERITAVLDWTNAAAGDPRTDVARTLSILRLEGRVPGRFPLELRRVLAPFERAWLAGYGGDLPDAIFRAWAGAFMADDMAAKRPPDHIARVRRWAGADAVNVVSEAFAAMMRGDLATVRRLVAPDLEWTYLDPSFESPEPQVCHGREELEAGLRRMAAHGLHPQLEEVAGRGDRVLVVEHTPGLDARRARQAGDRNFYVATVREGRITALRACRSRAEAAALVNQ
ncbi:MAG TPA: phosphotransferase, partial [Bacillota bacterium]|nr:phosphotransferase [Bacillota bacterium]